MADGTFSGHLVSPRHLVLNGRFLGRAPTGVDRVAGELAAALVARPEVRLTIATPRAPSGGASTPGAIAGHLWEQAMLPRLSGGDWCLNLCNTGPLFGTRQAVLIHDANVVTAPESYSPAFRAFYRALQPRLARRSALVLTVSHDSRRRLEAAGIVPPGRARVVPNGVDHMDRIEADPSVLARHGLSPGRYFLAAGSDARHKNLAMVAGVAAARGEGALPLVTAGGPAPRVFGPGQDAAGEVIRLGRVSDPELKALYTHARALLFPSRAEGFGLPPLEAMSCGTPVIATTAGAVPEVCGPAALYADPDRPEDWRHAMDRLEGDTALRQDLADRGRVRAAGFTWAHAAERLLAAIAEAEADGT